MKLLNLEETKSVSGAIDIYKYDGDTAKYITVDVPVTSPIKLAIDAGTAATLGATAGLLAGGPVGAFTGAIFGAVGVSVATLINDAYNMYEAAKKK